MFEVPISYLNSNDGNAILGFGEGPMLTLYQGDILQKLQKFLNKHNDSYIMLSLSYDLKNQIEELTSNKLNSHVFPEVIAWVPKYVVELRDSQVDFVQGTKENESLDFIRSFKAKSEQKNTPPLNHKLVPRISKKDYLLHVKELQKEIQNGNIYEINYCQEFFAEHVELKDNIDTYFKLNQLTKAPYSSFLNIANFSVFCGSPERYISRKGNKLISSPIKGTRRRGKNKTDDQKHKKELLLDKKERSENVMIVDLVRNDLSKLAMPGTVKVDELFGIYTFETVHQMISTISCELKKEPSFTDILKATFPMGSMTGAPKIRAMKLIEKHEDFRRGIYSGSIGYIKPNGDFDLNVIIRSLIYNKDKKYLSCPVGSAITSNSNPESEYEECLVKVQGILDGMNE